MKPSSRYSLVHILRTSSSNSAPSSRYSLVHILPTSSSNSAPNMSFLFLIFFVKSSSRYSLVHILPTSSSNSAPNDPVFYARFVDNFGRSRPDTSETETLLRRPRKPLYPKKTQGFAPESLSKLELNSRVPDLLQLPTT